MTKKVISPAKTFNGYKFQKWFVGNWKTIKELLKIGLPMALGWATTHNSALTGLITIGGKFIIDLGEFYFKESKE